MTRDDLNSALSEDMDRAGLVAAFSRGRAKREALAYRRQCHAALMELNPIPPEIVAMSDDELLAELSSPTPGA